MKPTAHSTALALICALTIGARQHDKIIDVHRAGYAPILTGTLTNPGWRDASIFTDFHTVPPQAGQKPAERTSAYIMYDNDNIYVALRMFDRHPELIRAVAKTRDGIEKDDWAAIYIDPSDDHQGAVYFQASPSGIQADGSVSADGRRIPGSGLHWTSVARKVPGGWIAEMSIPWTSLAIHGKNEVVMGFKVVRVTGRTGEEDDGPGALAASAPPLGQLQKICFKSAN